MKTQALTTQKKGEAASYQDRPVVYGGCIGDHYGHFITECLNTLWYFSRECSPETLVLFHSDMTVEEIFSRPWMVDLLRYAGVRKEQIIIPRVALRFSSITIPGQAFSEDGFVYTGYAKYLKALSLKAVQESSFDFQGMVYLSRANPLYDSRLPCNEEDLCAELSGRGVKVVRPEDLSVADQIKIFNANIVIGPIGSAFHTSIFAGGAKGIAICPQERPIARSYELMDAAHDAEIRYVYSEDKVDPSTLAEVLVNAAGLQAYWKKIIEKLRLGFLERKNRGNIFFVGHENILFSRYAKESGDYDVLVATVGNRSFIFANQPSLPPFFIEKELSETRVISYLRFEEEGGIGFQNPVNKKWLKAIPSELKKHLHCDADHVNDWELFRLKSVEHPDFSGDLKVLLEALSYLSDTGDMAGCLTIAPFLEDALQRFESSDCQ
nr:glycosyltransferase family 61 protein [Gluconobacter sphaericus]